jgi:hypothetical protein
MESTKEATNCVAAAAAESQAHHPTDGNWVYVSHDGGDWKSVMMRGDEYLGACGGIMGAKMPTVWHPATSGPWRLFHVGVDLLRAARPLYVSSVPDATKLTGAARRALVPAITQLRGVVAVCGEIVTLVLDPLWTDTFGKRFELSARSMQTTFANGNKLCFMYEGITFVYEVDEFRVTRPDASIVTFVSGATAASTAADFLVYYCRAVAGVEKKRETSAARETPPPPPPPAASPPALTPAPPAAEPACAVAPVACAAADSTPQPQCLAPSGALAAPPVAPARLEFMSDAAAHRAMADGAMFDEARYGAAHARAAAAPADVLAEAQPAALPAHPTDGPWLLGFGSEVVPMCGDKTDGEPISLAKTRLSDIDSSKPWIVVQAHTTYFCFLTMALRSGDRFYGGFGHNKETKKLIRSTIGRNVQSSSDAIEFAIKVRRTLRPVVLCGRLTLGRNPYLLADDDLGGQYMSYSDMVKPRVEKDCLVFELNGATVSLGVHTLDLVPGSGTKLVSTGPSSALAVFAAAMISAANGTLAAAMYRQSTKIDVAYQLSVRMTADGPVVETPHTQTYTVAPAAQ